MKQEFKLIIAGGRDFNDYKLMEEKILWIVNGELADRDVSIVSGCARGADSLAIQLAQNYNAFLHRMPADWDKWGKPAGFIRNKEMGNFADGLAAFWDGKSKGTAQMIEYMRSLNKHVYVFGY